MIIGRGEASADSCPETADALEDAAVEPSWSVLAGWATRVLDRRAGKDGVGLMRFAFFMACSVLGIGMMPARAEAEVPKIELPELMAVQLPPGAATIAANDPSVAKVLPLARCRGYEVRANPAQAIFGPGAIAVDWTAY